MKNIREQARADVLAEQETTEVAWVELAKNELSAAANVEKKMQAVASVESVIALQGDEFTMGGGNLREQVMAFISSIGDKVETRR